MRFDNRRRLYLMVFAAVMVTALAGYLALNKPEDARFFGGYMDLVRGGDGNVAEGQEREVPPPREENGVASIEEATISVVERVGPAVVFIRTVEEQVVDEFLGLFQRTREVSGVGSGVIFDEKGYILTNNHVVGNAKEITVQLPGRGNRYEAEVVGTDPFTDLAIIKIEGATKLPVAALGDSDKLRVGQYVIAIGNPLGFEYSVTSGLVSALQRDLVIDPELNLQVEGVIQTDASINPGNSGGPLLNLQGEVIGINTAIIARAQGIGFAVPVNTAKSIIDDILTFGKVIRLGIMGGEINPRFEVSYREQTGKDLPVDEGVFVISVLDGTPADRLGMRPEDVIVGLNGYRVREMADLVNLVRKVGYDGELEVHFYRNGKLYKKKTTLK